ncbi:hypothetical protein LCGC14_1610360 [marine sediment metagenome]|uniref:Uncharacterized protein n=1 Tax=marine sediment metagenome TaxID=412755 RepID=A0A0F9I8H1_9ZZZZ
MTSSATTVLRTVSRIYLPDIVWVSGYVLMTVGLGLELHRIKWPLPQNRCYEVVDLGDITRIYLRASAFRKDEPQEGEQP